MSDLDGRAFTRRGNSLVPSDFAADELLHSIPEGKEVMVTIRRPRSVMHQRWFFALLRIVCENTGHLWYDESDLLDALKRAVGYTEHCMDIDGSSYERPKSISFSTLSEDEFRIFKDKCLDVLATKVLGCDPVELMNEVDSTQKRAA